MREALRLAQRAAVDGEVPVGAVVVDADGLIVGRGHNRRERMGDPTAHAEIEALRQAAALRHAVRRDPSTGAQRRGSAWNLSDCTLVVTLEPCPMCAGAAVQSHIGSIVFGAWDAKMGACGSVWDIPRDPHIGERPEVFGGVRESECAAVLSGFFERRRDPAS